MINDLEGIKKIRNVKYPIHPIFIQRWSPRSFSQQDITEDEFFAVVEAGRLAPSSSNIQPWKLIYGFKNTKSFDILFDLLIDFNKGWCKNAGVLMCILSQKENNGKTNRTHSYDTGSFWVSMALQGFEQRTPLHGMAGFDDQKATELFSEGGKYHIEAMAAMGHPGKIEDLDEKYAKKEKISQRKSIHEIIKKASQA